MAKSENYRELVQCCYIYPTPGRNAGQQCTRMVEKRNTANWTGLCNRHVMAGKGKTRSSISIENDWNIWGRGS